MNKSKREDNCLIQSKIAAINDKNVFNATQNINEKKEDENIQINKNQTSLEQSQLNSIDSSQWEQKASSIESKKLNSSNSNDSLKLFSSSQKDEFSNQESNTHLQNNNKLIETPKCSLTKNPKLQNPKQPVSNNKFRSIPNQETLSRSDEKHVNSSKFPKRPKSSLESQQHALSKEKVKTNSSKQTMSTPDKQDLRRKIRHSNTIQLGSLKVASGNDRELSDFHSKSFLSKSYNIQSKTCKRLCPLLKYQHRRLLLEHSRPPLHEVGKYYKKSQNLARQNESEMKSK